METPLVSTQDGPRIMGLSNFGDKKAAPFGKGGKRKKKAARAKALRHKIISGPVGTPNSNRPKDLSNFTGEEIDLDWAAWDAAHKGQTRSATAAQTSSKGKDRFTGKSVEIARFQKMFGLPQTGAMNPETLAKLRKRAAAGKGQNLRAKAILAAVRGNSQRADRLEARRAARKAKPVDSNVSKRLAAAQRKSASLSTPSEADTDLSKLTAAARKALPASSFVFPKSRRYPIHDKAHAENALARSAGKPEHAVVKAAVRKRYPNLGK